MQPQPQANFDLALIVVTNELLAQMARLSSAARLELSELFRKMMKDGPYCSDIADRYQTSFDDVQLFTCYSSNGFKLEWYVEARERKEDDRELPQLRVILTQLDKTGRF